MSLPATFCSKQLSTSFDPLSEKSQVSLDWILANGIRAPQSAASGIRTIPSGGTVCSMPIKLSVCSDLPYDLSVLRCCLAGKTIKSLALNRYLEFVRDGYHHARLRRDAQSANTISASSLCV
ncbi:hypothetical protein B0H11DRAFT_2242059 [Mycena galericulata]|nr:hypothetical protein B0H11DRAFT_2242059 [Mycena galericulata]